MAIAGRIRVIFGILTIWETIVMVLLMRRIYNIRQWHGLRWHDIYTPSFMKIKIGFQVILRLCLRNVRGFDVGITLMAEIYDVRHWDAFKWHGMYVPSFMKIGEGVQTILRFCLRNLRGCNVGITEMAVIYELRRWDWVRWHDIHTHFHKDWLKYSEVNSGDTHAQADHSGRAV
jgi:hypothetical protein